VKTHTVKAGDCMLSIATANGHFWETLWNHPRNASLRRQRQDPFQLVAGDKVFVPDIQEKTLRGSTGSRHVVRIKGIPASVRVQVFAFGDEPYADAPFTLDAGGQQVKGTTTPDGIVQAFVPADATAAHLKVGEGDDAIELDLAIGHLDPPTETSGIQSRLANLGFYSGEPDGQESEELTAAIRDFQTAHGIEPSGRTDERTLEALGEQHG
jgi:hypothetical protein